MGDEPEAVSQQQAAASQFRLESKPSMLLPLPLALPKRGKETSGPLQQWATSLLAARNDVEGIERVKYYSLHPKYKTF
jgi:hypothetical protein